LGGGDLRLLRGLVVAGETGCMRQLRVFRRWVLGVAVAGALVAAGCASTVHQGGGPMMGGASSATAGPMMGVVVPGYHYSQVACAPPSGLPGTRVTVLLADMGMTQMMGGTAPLGVHMMLRSSLSAVAAGQVSLVAENRGWRTHELVVLPLAAGASAGHRVPGPDGKVSESGSLAEASANCATGTGSGITARGASWTTLTLVPGRYELLCNLPNHYADGMWSELTIT
jgi:uncharacterized cupredoxin-like copper-binding protein